MNARQEAFVREYMIDRNATQAALRAGYASRSAAAQGNRLMQKDEIKDAIAAATAAQYDRLEITADAVRREIAKIAFSDIGHFVTWGPQGVVLRDAAELPPGATAVVAEVSETTTQHGGTRRIKLHDKLGALRSLAEDLKSLGEDPADRARQIREALDALDAATSPAA